MAQAYLDFGAPFLFDCVTREHVSQSATVTEHAVETGSDIADHIRQENATIELDIIVTNTPLRDVNNIWGGQVAGLELKVPRYDRPLSPTPGSLMTAGLDAIGNALNPPEPVAATVMQWPEKFNNVAFVLGSLLDWKDRGVIGKVITPHRTYESVVITRVDVTRTSETGAAAEISLELRQIRLVEAKLVTAPAPSEVRGETIVAKGRQPTSFVRDPGPKKSFFYALRERFRGGGDD